MRLVLRDGGRRGSPIHAHGRRSRRRVGESAAFLSAHAGCRWMSHGLRRTLRASRMLLHAAVRTVCVVRTAARRLADSSGMPIWTSVDRDAVRPDATRSRRGWMSQGSCVRASTICEYHAIVVILETPLDPHPRPLPAFSRILADRTLPWGLLPGQSSRPSVPSAIRVEYLTHTARGAAQPIFGLGTAQRSPAAPRPPSATLHSIATHWVRSAY